MCDDSPKAIYKHGCEALKVHCNTALMELFSDDPSQIESIERLDLSRNCLGKNGVRPLLSVIARCKNLTHLNLSDNYLDNSCMTDVASVLTARCPRLAYLNVSHNPISNPAGKMLSRLVEEKASLTCVVTDGTLMNPALAGLVAQKARVRKTTADTHKGLHLLASATEGSSRGRPSERVSPRQDAPEDWFAMETIWNLAAVAAPPNGGWSGLASVMALVRKDASIATMYSVEADA